MIISKGKNIVLTFDNDLSISDRESGSGKKGIVFDFVTKTPEKLVSDDNTLYITNPGEYEFSGVLLKVSEDMNIFISVDNLKLYYVCDVNKVESDKNITISDVFIFDDLMGKGIKSDEILDIHKFAQPKAIVVNSNHLSGELNNAEKISKLKLKNSDIESFLDTKLYLI